MPKFTFVGVQNATMKVGIPRHPRLTLQQASNLLFKQKINSTTLSKQCHERAIFGEEQLKLNAFTHLLSYDKILEQAQSSDKRIQQNERLSPLDGIPVTVKANIAVKGLPFTAGSRILGEYSAADLNDGYYESPIDAFVVQRLLHDSGAVLIGITSMDEFGMGSLGTNVPDKSRIPKSPLPFLAMEERGLVQDDTNELDLPHLSTGGSSSGAASSISFGSSLLSIGTDTGGSVRLPSAWNAVVGFKPTYGWMSRHGIIEYASSLDTVGLIAPSVDCAHLAMNCLLPNHENEMTVNDATSTKLEHLQLLDGNPNLKGVKIGIPSSFCITETPSYIMDAWEASATYLYEKFDAEIVVLEDDDLSKEWIKQSLAAYYVLACAEASSNLSRYDGVRYGMNYETPFNYDSAKEFSALEQQYGKHRSTFFGDEVIRRILCGNAVLSSDRYHSFYESAAKVRAILSKQFTTLFREKVDVMLVPTSLSSPWDLQKDFKVSATTKMYENDIMTVPMSLACLPSISIPIKCQSNDNAMIGFQIFGPKLGENDVLKVGRSLETMNSRNNK